MSLRPTLHALTGAVIGLVAATALLLALGQTLGVFRLVPVLSGSMSGTVEAGDAAVLRPTTTDELVIGDVIAFYPPLPGAPLTLHRITDLDRSGGEVVVRTKGDANSVADPWRAVLDPGTAWRTDGRVLPGLGDVVLGLQRPHARVALLGATVGLILAATLRRIWRDGGQAARDVPTPTAGVAATLGIAAVALASGLLITGAADPAAAAFTDRTAAAQSVTASWDDVEPPRDLTAALVCELGVPTGVQLTWTGSTSTEVLDYLVERGSDEFGPFAGIGTTTTTEYLDEGIDAVMAGEMYYRVRGRTTGDHTTPTNTVTLLATCPTGDV